MTLRDTACVVRLCLYALGTLLALGASAPAPAAVEISFRSHAMGASFPHAYVVLSGTLDATGRRVEANYGFTVRHEIGPSILFGPVEGTIDSETREHAAGGRRHFSLRLSDEEFGRVLRVVTRWRALPQPSYHLDRRTCVTFVAEVATALGLAATPDRAMQRRPQAFLERVRRDNAAIIAARSSALAAPSERARN